MEIEREIVRGCAAFNRERVKYIVVGGCAVILHGYRRTTYDIDLLVDPSSENIRRLKEVFREMFQPDEISEIRDVDIEQYAVIRFAPESEEIVIDLIGKIGKVNFEAAIKDIRNTGFRSISMMPWVNATKPLWAWNNAKTYMGKM